MFWENSLISRRNSKFDLAKKFFCDEKPKMTKNSILKIKNRSPKRLEKRKKWVFLEKTATILGNARNNEVFQLQSLTKWRKKFLDQKKIPPRYYAYMNHQKIFQSGLTSGSAGLRKNMRDPPYRHVLESGSLITQFQSSLF